MTNCQFILGSKKIGPKALFFTVEEGMANYGNFDHAVSMIDAAAKAEVDAIEFQLVIASDFCIRKHPVYDFCSKIELLNSRIKELVSYAKRKSLEFIAAPLSARLVDPLVEVGCSGLNINASDINNPEIIDAVAESGLPFFLSLPLASEPEIDWAVNRILKKTGSHFALLHGQHTMMSGKHELDLADTTLGCIATLKRKYGVPVGYIDHTPYLWMPAVAVSAGADIVSKHIILSRSSKGPDWQICLEPNEMKDAVSWASKIKTSINETAKVVAIGEEADRLMMRKSIVAARSLKAGERIARKDFGFKRPGNGIPPSQHEEIVGRTIDCDINEDDLLNETHFEKKA